jgi:hypothetical protein
MQNPAIASGSLIGKWFHEAMRSNAEQYGAAPAETWELLPTQEKSRLTSAGTEVLELLRSAGLLNVHAAQIAPGLGVVLPSQRAN